MNPVEAIHEHFVSSQRARKLVDRMAEIIPRDSVVLDVGCGDGRIDRQIAIRRPDLTITGIDVLVRGEAAIDVEPFDGSRIPRGDASVDVVMFVDVLHHTDDPMVLLAEAARVARKAVVIKDHNLAGFLAGPTLRFMDRIGNARYGVELPYNYWPRRQWAEAFDQVGLELAFWHGDLDLYPWPANLIFGRQLHFIAKLLVGCHAQSTG